MKSIIGVISIVVLIHGAAAFMCYTRPAGSETTSVAFCFKGSCYSTGASLLSAATTEKGCSDDWQETGCRSLSLAGLASTHYCFCNSFLCNSSSLPSSPLLMVLLLPCLIARLL